VTECERQVAAADEHPKREGMPDCSFFTKTGSCKFGASCKFNHPRSSGAQRAGSFSNNYDSQSVSLACRQLRVLCRGERVCLPTACFMSRGESVLHVRECVACEKMCCM